jgi:hypothetical protein
MPDFGCGGSQLSTDLLSIHAAALEEPAWCSTYAEPGTTQKQLARRLAMKRERAYHRAWPLSSAKTGAHAHGSVGSTGQPRWQGRAPGLAACAIRCEPLYARWPPAPARGQAALGRGDSRRPRPSERAGPSGRPCGRRVPHGCDFAWCDSGAPCPQRGLAWAPGPARSQTVCHPAISSGPCRARPSGAGPARR